MLIEKIDDNSPYIPQIAALLHWEWSSLPRWSTQEGIQQRFIKRNHVDSEEFTLVAYVEDGQLLGTASVIVHELMTVLNADFGLVKFLRPQNIAVKALVRRSPKPVWHRRSRKALNSFTFIRPISRSSIND